MPATWVLPRIRRDRDGLAHFRTAGRQVTDQRGFGLLDGVHVLLTGGTGFAGQAMLEKLLSAVHRDAGPVPPRGSPLDCGTWT